tara:strand:- start:3061 stop:3411 length:351 start_codon:yes stop_codon:yes gene_type:complete
MGFHIPKEVIQFLIGGGTVVAASLLSDLKGNFGVFLGALLSTFPAQDMLPVLFIKEQAKSESFALRNAISNISVLIAMLVISYAMKMRASRAGAVAIGGATWLVIAVVVQLFLSKV